MEDKKKMMEESEGTNKRDFLKVLGAGLGIAGISSVMGGQAFADVEKKEKYVFVITHGGDDPNRAIFGLLMAQTVAEKNWGKVHVWMTLDGADLVNKKKTERIESPIYKKFGNAFEIMRKIKDRGVRSESVLPVPSILEPLAVTSMIGLNWPEATGS